MRRTRAPTPAASSLFGATAHSRDHRSQSVVSTHRTPLDARSTLVLARRRANASLGFERRKYQPVYATIIKTTSLLGVTGRLQVREGMGVTLILITQPPGRISEVAAA